MVSGDMGRVDQQGARGEEGAAVTKGPLSSRLGTSVSLPALPALPGCCIDLLESF